MEYLVAIALVILAGYLLIRKPFHRIVVFEYERGLLYRHGIFRRVLEPGVHWVSAFTTTVTKLDIRPRTVTISGQEVLSADHIGLKISLIAQYAIGDPHQAILSNQNYQEALYLFIQVGLRTIVGMMNVEDVLANRQRISEQLLAQTTAQAQQLGLQMQAIDIKDITFPGDVKRMFAQVVKARQEGLAALEKARGESAALRNLANTARMLDHNPSLLQLRALLAVSESAGSTVVFSASPTVDPALLRQQGNPNAGEPSEGTE